MGRQTKSIAGMILNPSDTYKLTLFTTLSKHLRYPEGFSCCGLWVMPTSLSAEFVDLFVVVDDGRPYK